VVTDPATDAAKLNLSSAHPSFAPAQPLHVDHEAAAAGVSPGALQARAGHADLGTTQRYIDLAGVRFREEAELAEARMFGSGSIAAAAETEMGSTDG
jgi:hypothetical protein